MFDSSNTQFDSHESTQESSANRTATTRPYHHSVTTLPAFGPEVLPVVLSGKRIHKWAKFALLLLDEGYLSDDDVNLDPVRLVKRGLKNFIANDIGSIESCSLDFDVVAEIADHGYSFVNNGDIDTTKDEEVDELYLRISPNRSGQYAIGQKLQQVEKLVPGLGKTAYYWLVTKGVTIFGIMSPWHAKNEVAPSTWWYGADTQKEFVEMLEEYNEEEETSNPSPKQWSKAFPGYINNIKEALKIDQLKELSNTHSDNFIKEIAKITVQIAEHEDFDLPHVYHTEYYPVHSPIYLHWKEGDMLSRLMDDFFQYASQCSDVYTEDLGVVKCPIDDAAAMKELLGNLRKGLTQLKNIEHLINLIGVQI